MVKRKFIFRDWTYTEDGAKWVTGKQKPITEKQFVARHRVDADGVNMCLAIYKLVVKNGKKKVHWIPVNLNDETYEAEREDGRFRVCSKTFDGLIEQIEFYNNDFGKDDD